MNDRPSDRRSTPAPARMASVLTCAALLILLPACGIQLDARNTGNLPGLSGDAPFGALPPSAPPEALADDSMAAMREIEEADVLKVVGDKVYVLNQYKGLIIIDVSDPDKPAIMGRLEFTGRPVEMYVVGPRAYVITSSDYYYPVYRSGIAAEDDAVFAPPAFDGSKVAVIDVADPTQPKSMGDVRLVGYASASRRVGDVIYVVGRDSTPNPPPTQSGGGSSGSASVIAPDYYYNRGFVASINVADPDNIIPVDRKTFENDAVNLHVSATALFATSTDWDYSNDRGEVLTNVQYVDISDPAGQIRLRDTVSVPGTIRNRFYLDDYQGALRIVTESFGFGFRTVRLFTYDLANPDDIQPLGQTEIIRGESLEAVRFDGPRGYAVTFLRVDPLFVLDLSDPADPRVAGQLKVPGYSTHIEPRGDRLIAVGIDDTAGTRPAVVLYDVADPAAPKELSRIVLGPPNTFTESAATWDEKAFKIIEELGLITMPFRYYKYDDVVIQDEPVPGSRGGALPLIYPPPYQQPTCVTGVQLIDYGADSLRQRGWFDHKGNVERVGVIGTRAYAMSQMAFQTVNIDDRDHPVSAAVVPFFEGDEATYFDDCGGYYPPIDWPVIDIPFFPLLDVFFAGLFSGLDTAIIEQVVADLTDDDGVCGTMGTLPLVAMAGVLGFVRVTRRRRRW
ncbi:MAG: beta-propeller domain-containing protein [Phycisphaerae bacterium]|nr:beta-propeller domain-containing protein [Phycisphaerae bacterium]NUQ47212.1 beta-propeller domain-containing protein [Phycisphaerae bacterium]